MNINKLKTNKLKLAIITTILDN